MIDEKDLKKFSLIFLAAIIIIIGFVILRPIILAIFGGLILAYIFNPFYRVVQQVVRSKNLASLLMCFFIILLILLPLWFLAPLFINSVFDFYTSLQKINLASVIERNFPSFFASEEFNREFATSLNNFISKITQIALNLFSNLVINLPELLLQMAVALFVFFFTLRDSAMLKAYIKSLSPLNKEFEAALITRFKDLTFAVVHGQILLGILHGLLIGLGLYIFDIPHALIFTTLAILFSILPIIGSLAIWPPISLYLIFNGRYDIGIGFFVYGLCISWIIYYYRSSLAKKGGLHPGVAFVGIIGGMFVFGVLGIFLGPIIISYFLILLDLYKQKKLFE